MTRLPLPLFPGPVCRLVRPFSTQLRSLTCHRPPESCRHCGHAYTNKHTDRRDMQTVGQTYLTETGQTGVDSCQFVPDLAGAPFRLDSAVPLPFLHRSVPFRSVPSPFRRRSVAVPFCSVSVPFRPCSFTVPFCPVPSPFRRRSFTVPSPFLHRSVPVPSPFLHRSVPVPSPFLHRSVAVPFRPVPFRPRSVPVPSPFRSVPFRSVAAPATVTPVCHGRRAALIVHQLFHERA